MAQGGRVCGRLGGLNAWLGRLLTVIAGLFLRRHSGARVKRANPESMAPLECREKWIPGLRRTAHPGMTKRELECIEPPGHALSFPRRNPRPSDPSARPLKERAQGMPARQARPQPRVQK
jgi:hypothetical protein